MKVHLHTFYSKMAHRSRTGDWCDGATFWEGQLIQISTGLHFNSFQCG